VGSFRAWLIVVVVGGCQFTAATATNPAPDGSAEVTDAPARDVTIVPALCGNNTLDSGEECDDGGTSPGDGCDASCQIEPAWQCPGGKSCVLVTGLAFGDGEDLQEAGTSGGGTAFTNRCPTGAALVGFDGFLTAVNTQGGQLIGSLRSECAVIVFDAAGSGRSTSVTKSGYQGADFTVPAGATTCADGNVVVGFVANSGLYLAGLQLYCVPLSFVHGSLMYGTEVLLDFYGSNAGQEQPPTQCAADEVAATFDGRSGGVIDQFDVKCAAVTPVTN